MAHSAEQIAADEAAISDHRCPETGVSLKPMNAAALRHHVKALFPHAGEFSVAGSDYQRRHDMLSAYFTARFKEAI